MNIHPTTRSIRFHQKDQLSQNRWLEKSITISIMSPLLGPLSEIDTILEKLEDDEDVQKVFTNLV